MSTPPTKKPRRGQPAAAVAAAAAQAKPKTPRAAKAAVQAKPKAVVAKPKPPKPPVFYVSFRERSHKEHECWLRFVQWTGNEKPLRRLAELCQRVAHVDPGYSERSSFDMDTDHLIPQAAVEAVVAVEIGTYTNILGMVSGTFTLPADLWQDDWDHGDLYDALSSYFCCDQISLGRHFDD